MGSIDVAAVSLERPISAPVCLLRHVIDRLEATVGAEAALLSNQGSQSFSLEDMHGPTAESRTTENSRKSRFASAVPTLPRPSAMRTIMINLDRRT